jgi:D-alanyl-D-alanine carboxypeptidase/D-alanyl-D-alanine-endopeptidase (penicillin-binding protein 4)
LNPFFCHAIIKITISNVRMKRLFKVTKVILLSCGLSLLSSISMAASLESISQLIQKEIPQAKVGISALDAKTGQSVYDYHGNDYLMPASNEKIFTALAAFYYLTPDYHFHTTISVPPKTLFQGTEYGNIYFNFVGDPSFRTTELKEMIKTLKAQGVKHIQGNVILNVTRFGGNNYAAGWALDTINWHYSAPITAATLNENATSLVFRPNERPGAVTPAVVGAGERFFKVTDHVHVPTAQEAAHGCSFSININQSNEVNLDGCWPASRDTTSLSIAVKNPSLMVADWVSDMLSDAGITVQGRIVIEHTATNIPANLVTLVDHSSQPLTVIIKRMLKKSDDFYAECIVKTLGFEYFHQGDFQHGLLAMITILHEKTGVDFSQSKLSDGSGQSYFNSVTPEQLARLLYAVQSTSFFKIFYSSLPISGHDGTLMYRLSNKSLSGKVHAKTGTLPKGGVVSLSGYLHTAKGRELTFSILINHLQDDVPRAKGFADQVVAMLYRQ